MFLFALQLHTYEKKVSYLDVLVGSKVDTIICVDSTYEEKRFYEKL